MTVASGGTRGDGACGLGPGSARAELLRTYGAGPEVA